MRTQFTGSVKMAGESADAINVRVHLDDEKIVVSSSDGATIGEWPLGAVGIASRQDGFHLRIEGEEMVLRTEDDARFALELGLATPNNRLARQMARLRDEQSASVVVDLSGDPDVSVPLAPIEPLMPASRKDSRQLEGLSYLGPIVVIAATVAFLCSIVALASGSAISFPAGLPAWPAMAAASLFLAAGGFGAYQNPVQGRVPIAGGVVLGLFAILLSAGRLVDEGLAGEAFFGFTFVMVLCGALLAIDTARMNAET